MADIEGFADEVGAGSDHAPAGLVTVAGALADWAELDKVVLEIYEARRQAKDRGAPNLD